MIKKVFEKLDKWIVKENASIEHVGGLRISHVNIHVIGQTALLEAQLSFFVAATMDVDIYDQLEFGIKKKLEEFLAVEGRVLDPVGHEAWMPEETEYQQIYDGQYVRGCIANPVFVILSKAKKAPEKNRNLIIEYLASKECDPRIFDLSEKYEIDLEIFV